jgi:hypothetical protein
MNTPYSDEELKSYFAGFESMGEPSVRAAINSDSWRYEQLRLGAAKEWIRQIDEARRVPETKPLHETLFGKIAVGVVIGVIVALLAWFFGFYANQFLHKDQSQGQPTSHDQIQKINMKENYKQVP